MTQRKRVGRTVVLDTGAVLAGIDLAGDSRYFITPLAFAELINPNARLKAEICRGRRRPKNYCAR